MKKIISIVLLFFVSVNCLSIDKVEQRIDSLLHVLDGDIRNAYTYIEAKEKRLNDLKEQLKSTRPTSIDRYELNNRLFAEYKAYSSDSSFHYLNRNQWFAQSIRDKDREIKILLEQSKLLTTIGVYMEAKDILTSIDRKSLSPSLLEFYYTCCRHLYQEASVVWPYRKIMPMAHKELCRAYEDSMALSLDSLSEEFMHMRETQLRDSRKYEEALQMNDRRLATTALGDPLYALVAYNRFQILCALDEKEGLRYLILSAICDVRSAINEQSSLMRLAQLLYKRGDIERANCYANYAWQAAKSYNTRMRSWSSIEPLSIINSGYQNIISQQNNKLRMYIFFITLLVVMLAVSLMYIWRQMKNLKIARKGLQEVNERLFSLNDELETVNRYLQSMNMELSESNKIKEVYIARFFKLCSTYVDRLHSYRKLVNKKLQKKEINELLKMTSPASDLQVTEVQELYANFDAAFLHLFPNFVKSLNDLLLPEEQIVLKEGELLNTELRILALIRLGINKSGQIAELLHYSPTTIYNYRARLREKARTSLGDFEEQVAQIR